MQIKGRVIDKQSQPVSDANVEVTARGTSIGETDTDAQGIYTLPYDGSCGPDLQIVVTKDGFDKQDVAYQIKGNAGEIPDVTLLRRRPPPPPPPPPPPLPKSWQRTAVVAGIVLVIVLLALLLRPGPKGGTGGQGNYQVEVQVVLKTKDKDTTLNYKAPGPVRQVSVKFDDDPVQTFANKDLEGRTFLVQVPQRFRRALAVTTQIDSQPPQRFEFMTPDEAKARDAADHVYNGVHAMNRIGVAVSTLTSKDPKMVAYAKSGLEGWIKDYLSRLEALAASNVDPSKLANLITTFQPNAPYAKAEDAAIKVFLPIMKTHYVHFLNMRSPPPSYTNDIHDAYRKLPNTPIDLFNRESKGAGDGR